MNEKILFRSSSTSKRVPFHLANIIGLVLLGYLSLHFQENPPVIGVIMLISALAICLNSRKICVVLDDRFKLRYQRFIPLFSGSKDFPFTEISSIEAILPLTRSAGTGGPGHPFENTIILNYHDGRIRQLSVNISREDLQEAFRLIRMSSSILISESY